jgi:hypothetical protein
MSEEEISRKAGLKDLQELNVWTDGHLYSLPEGGVLGAAGVFGKVVFATVCIA